LTADLCEGVRSGSLTAHPAALFVLRIGLAYSELMATVLLIGLLGFALDAVARGLYRLWRCQ
jgi:hypothetical protein